jgi:hypothetical protein
MMSVEPETAPYIDCPGYPQVGVEIGSPVYTKAHVASLDGPAVGVITDYELTFDGEGYIEVLWDHTDTRSWWPSEKLRHAMLDVDPPHRSLGG